MLLVVVVQQAQALQIHPRSINIIEIFVVDDKIRAAATVLNQHLAGREFMVGNTITLADIDIAAPFSQIDRARLPFEEFPNLVAWHNRLLESFPAWAETKVELDHRMESFLASVGVTL
jgi:glutathione S-transferase